MKLNPNVLKAQYAVRGAIVQHASKLQQSGKEIVFCNIGNPQALNQKPLTYVRQLVSAIEYPGAQQVPDDIRRRSSTILETIGSPGAYSDSHGHRFIRESVSNFIAKRDKSVAPDPDNIVLSNGASSSIQTIMNILRTDDDCKILIPIPQYPLYSATLQVMGTRAVPYYLDEENQWSMNIDELKETIRKEKETGSIKALVVINPGNPTGQVMTEQNIRDVIKVCDDEQICILADEVYQENVFDDHTFTSFKKVWNDLGASCPLFSFHSTSKGLIGECGKRGGYLEMAGIEPDNRDEILKFVSIQLCSNISGQLTVEAMVNPPKTGDESFPQYQQEYDELKQSMARRANKLWSGLNTLTNISCNKPAGAMYLFPKIVLPDEFISHAKRNDQEPDHAYCMHMLEESGVCWVPGSGFGQKEGTFHFRTTFLPQEDQLDRLLDKIQKAHEKIMN